MLKEVIEIMPMSSSKKDEDIALLQKYIIDELSGVSDNGIINILIDEELKKLKK